MPRVFDKEWYEKQLHDQPPNYYKMTVAEFGGFLSNDDDFCLSLAAAYNYGFRRGRNFERNALRRRETGKT